MKKGSIPLYDFDSFQIIVVFFIRLLYIDATISSIVNFSLTKIHPLQFKGRSYKIVQVVGSYSPSISMALLKSNLIKIN